MNATSKLFVSRIPYFPLTTSGVRVKTSITKHCCAENVGNMAILMRMMIFVEISVKSLIRGNVS